MTCGDAVMVRDFATLSGLLLGSRSREGVRALARTGENAGRSVGDGRLLDLVQDKDVPDDAAMVGVIRPDCVAVDFDGTAWLLPHVLDAAGAVGASVVYLALSGSPESVHAVLAAPTAHSHAAMVNAVAAIRDWAGVDAKAVDVRGRSPLRLPGSPSLKSHGFPVVPCDESLTPITAKEATSRAVAALKHVGLPKYRKQVPGAAPAVVAAKSRRVEDRPITETLRGRIAGGWHNGFTMTSETRAAAETPAPAGANRTAHAASVAWLLYKDGGRSFDDVAPVVMVAPAFARWRRGGRPECERRWAMMVRRFVAFNPPMTDEESTRLDAAAAAAAHVLPPDLVPVLLGIVEASRMNTDRDAVPVSCRSLVVWGVSSSAKTAHRALSALHEVGVLTRVRDYFDSPASEATLWRVNGPEAWDVDTAGSIPARNDTRSEHPLPSIPEALGPCSPLHWVLNQQEVRTLRALLTGTPSFSVSTCAHHAGVSERSARAWLSRLVSLGLVERIKRGRNVGYRAAVSLHDLQEHQVWADAFEVYRKRCEVVAGDRDAWADWLAANRGVLDGDEGSRRADRVEVITSRWSGDDFEAVESVEVRASGVTVRRTTYEPPGLGAAAAASTPHGDAVRAGPGVIECSGDP